MKRNISIILALVLVFVLSVSAGADEITQDTADTGNTIIEYTVPQTYTVYIQETVRLQNGTKECGVSVYSPMYIPHGTSINVSISAASNYAATPEGFKLKDEVNDIYISYTIDKINTTDGTLSPVVLNTPFLTIDAGGASGTATLRITAVEPQFAGTYEDTLTFTVVVE